MKFLDFTKEQDLSKKNTTNKFIFGLLTIFFPFSFRFIIEIIEFFKAKEVAIIGPNASGKTTLWNFLIKGTIQNGYIRTQATNKLQKIKLEELDLIIKKAKDVPGSMNFVKDWIDIAKESDYVFYLFRFPCIYCKFSESKYCYVKGMNISKVEGSGYEISKCYEENFYQIKINLENIEKEVDKDKVILVGTFLDRLPDSEKWTKNEYLLNQLYNTQRKQNDHELFQIFQIFKTHKFMIGSLKDIKSAEELTIQMFKLAAGGKR